MADNEQSMTQFKGEIQQNAAWYLMKPKTVKFSQGK